MNGPVQRRLIILFPFLLLVLAAVAIVLLTSGRTSRAPATFEAVEENAANPYTAEMDCIDQLMQRNDLAPEEVGPALQNCRGTPADTNRAGLR